MLIQDTRAIVSGGASGLGLAVAELVVAAGGKVALFDVNDQAGVDAVRKLGPAASFHKVDVTVEKAVAAAVAAAITTMGGLNLAVSCAGVGWPKRMVGKEGTMPGDFFARSSKSTWLARCCCARKQRPPCSRTRRLPQANVVPW